ncbi:hypothetical protein [Streptomyces sp. GC420]|uniref:hypothetical protein n=1 Tax=Streptomyces sp. GC420 TaxID=2697568 RepID=UPI001AA10FE2|nr:hypothetical protein [Streptomyces sp. GC420]
MEALADNTNIRSHYVAQVNADLERNTREQERIGAEIVSLQEQLKKLEHDRELLLGMQQALGGETAGDTGTATEDAAPAVEEQPVVPKARKAKEATDTKNTTRAEDKAAARDTAGAGTTKAARSTRSVKATAGKGKKKTAPAKAAPAKASPRLTRPASGPTLRELVRRHLVERSEPRSAIEVTAALGEAFPERTLSTTVVRNTLESLVAKGEAHRTKQQRSVFYTAAGSSSPAAGDGAGGAGEGGAGEPEAAAAG